MKQRTLFILGLSVLLLIACGLLSPAASSDAPPIDDVPTQAAELPTPTLAIVITEAPPVPTEAPMPFELTSVVFAQKEGIPVKYSCNGEDISPPLAWGDPRTGTQSLALIMDDPDAAGWIHWIVFNIPADVRELPEDMPAGMKFGDVATTFGRNSWGRSDYGGPCPPSGMHRYFFKLYALDTTLSLDDSAKKPQVLAAMDGHILAEIELMGFFSR